MSSKDQGWSPDNAPLERLARIDERTEVMQQDMQDIKNAIREVACKTEKNSQRTTRLDAYIRIIGFVAGAGVVAAFSALAAFFSQGN